MSEVPRQLGFDESGREVLTYLSGTILDDATPSIRWSGSILQQASQLLRRIHDASQGLELDGREWRTVTHEPIEVVCHNDFAPYNLVVQGDRLTGVIDFDMASPGPGSGTSPISPTGLYRSRRTHSTRGLTRWRAESSAYAA